MISGKPINEPPTILQTTPEYDRFIEKIHPNARRRIKPGAKYISAGRRSYEIHPIPRTSLWKIKPYYGGQPSEELKNRFTSYREAEATLIQYLRRKDKWGRAWYPGCRWQEQQ